jgi:hypothetical protein
MFDPSECDELECSILDKLGIVVWKDQDALATVCHVFPCLFASRA